MALVTHVPKHQLYRVTAITRKLYKFVRTYFLLYMYNRFRFRGPLLPEKNRGSGSPGKLLASSSYLLPLNMLFTLLRLSLQNINTALEVQSFHVKSFGKVTSKQRTLQARRIVENEAPYDWHFGYTVCMHGNDRFASSAVAYISCTDGMSSSRR